MDPLALRNFEPLIKLVKEVRETVRTLLEAHYQEIPHNVDRKDIEVTFMSDIINLVTRKWSIQILWELEIHQGLNFNELMRHLDGISSRSLSDTLKLLEQANLIDRVVEDTRPPKVKYILNDKGEGFVELSLLIIWHLGA